MTVNNINSSTAQLQLYTNEKAGAVNTSAASADKSATALTAQQDSVQISEQARALSLNSIPGNGGGIEPPKTSSASGAAALYTTLGNGGGIEPPKTGTATKTDTAFSTLGNGGGIEPPKL